MWSSIWFSLHFLLLSLFQLTSSLNISSPILCHTDDSFALLQLKPGFQNAFNATLFPFDYDFFMYELTDFSDSISGNPYDYFCGEESHTKTNSWRNGTDCCKWDGVQCDPSTGHVIGLDLSCSRLNGTISSNNSLFLLRHLQYLNLAFNDFSHSPILPPEFSNFPFLKYLNLSYSKLSGNVPSSFAKLSQLNSLDLSFNFNDLKMPNFEMIIKNLTHLRQLHLDGVEINSVVPHSLANLSSLTLLSLFDCGLVGHISLEIVNLPHLRVLDLGDNSLLFASNFTQFNWSRPLEELDFESCNISGQLPQSVNGHSKPLRRLVLSDNQFHGPIPLWIWNTTEFIDLGFNYLSGELPSSISLASLSTLRAIVLGDNMLNGSLPSWLFSLPSIELLFLDDNQFSGELPLWVNGSLLSNLWGLYLSSNLLNGSLPSWLFALPSLTDLNIAYNNFSATVDLNMFSRLKNLNYLSLSQSGLSVLANSTKFTSLSCIELDLGSCNLSEFPRFSKKTLQKMVSLDLSNNQIHGEIPKWMQNLENLEYLNLSHNFLTSGLENIPWKGAYVVDVRFNLLRGMLPMDIFKTTLLFASNNRLSGEIPLSICGSNVFQVLDLSNNSLSGGIPACLIKSNKQLEVLDLRLNKLNGTLCLQFEDSNALKTLALNGNQLEGPVPRSLAKCKYLEVLDLGNNKLNGSFPYWVDTLPELKVLILRNNSFHGVIASFNCAKHPFPKLQILDLSGNNFNGNLPMRYIDNFEAMIDDGKITKRLGYVGSDLNNNYYSDSIVLTMKGIFSPYERILLILISIDLSNNRFHGEILESIGRLNSLISLNLSHNNITGEIPPSLGNLMALESLDLSLNMLTGQIPQELGDLHYLESFNVSVNKLIGCIPTGKQFNTFMNDSYFCNPGLCGFPLPECGEHSATLEPMPSIATQHENNSEFFEWKIILMGYGCGLVFGLIGGCYMLLLGKPFWLLGWIYRVESLLMEYKKKRLRMHKRN